MKFPIVSSIDLNQDWLEKRNLTQVQSSDESHLKLTSHRGLFLFYDYFLDLLSRGYKGEVKGLCVEGDTEKTFSYGLELIPQKTLFQENLWGWDYRPQENSKRAIFLDRDGVLIKDSHYPDDFSKVEFKEGVIKVLGSRSCDFDYYILSNQSGVARGYFSFSQAQKLQDDIEKGLKGLGLEIKGSALCPYHKEGSEKEFARKSHFRKPFPGMLLHFLDKSSIDPRASFMIGDKTSDALDFPLLRTLFLKGEYELDLSKGDLLRDSEDLKAALLGLS